MTNLTRAQSTEMWELISKGGLRDIEAHRLLEQLGGMSPLEFVEQVAAKILAANACEPKSRPAQIAMAAGLGGTMPDLEAEIRRAISVLSDFHGGVTIVESRIKLSKNEMRIAVNLVQSFLGYDESKNPDPKMYGERARQVRDFLKSKRI